MFINFFYELKEAKLPVTVREYLTLMEALQAGIAQFSMDEFYYLCRAALIKDERNLDKFDKVFAQYFHGFEYVDEALAGDIPEEWLKAMAEKFLSDEEMAELEGEGGFEKLMETLKKRMAEQNKRHEGGNKMMGTEGTSPFGNSGANPEGVRMDKDSQKRRQGKAAKVWEGREYKNLDDSVELGTRNIKVALRRLRKFAREGAEEELDLDDTIRSTAHKGYLDVKLVPEKRNKIKVLVFFDVGGSMDAFIKLCEELFSAARTEFKHLEYFYFHNCLYEKVWKDNGRRHQDTMSTWDVMHTFPHDYKVIFVGDATMSPYEITYAGGSVEHWNEEPGAEWLNRVFEVYPSAIWLNPVAENHWDYTPSIELIQRISRNRMFPLTIKGLDSAMRELNR